MTVPDSKSSKNLEETPAKPAVVLLATLVVTFCFYLFDCLIVTQFQDHPNSPWIEGGVHALGPFGFGMTFLFFIVGIFSWLREVARLADQKRKAANSQNLPNMKGDSQIRE